MEPAASVFRNAPERVAARNDAMKNKTSQILYAYWNEVRGKRIAPRRFEIEPARIGSILPETFILERTENATHRFRLAGTRIFESFGVEFRGTDFLALWQGVDRDLVAVELGNTTAQGGIVVFAMEAATSDGRRAVFEVILMPLVHTGQVIDRIVGAISCANPPSWLGTERLDNRRLVERETIWADGRPHAVLASGERQPPFAPHTRTAKLVRSDRRQFRVYDGGLAKDERGDA
jgi:hypothetical protein